MFVTRYIDLGEEGSIDVDFFSTSKEVCNDSCGWQDVSGSQVYDEQPDYIDVTSFDYIDQDYSDSERKVIDAYIKKNKFHICKELSKVETELYREWGGDSDKQKY